MMPVLRRKNPLLISAARARISEWSVKFHGLGAALQVNEACRFGKSFSEGMIYNPGGINGLFISKMSCVRQ